MNKNKQNEPRSCRGESAVPPKRRSPVPVIVRGHVLRLYISEPRYSAGRFRTADGLDITFSGKFMVAERDPLVLTGHWVQHPRYGQQLKVTSQRFDDSCKGADEGPR